METLLEPEIAIPAAPAAPRRARSHAGRPIGEILLAHQAITPAKLEEALKLQAEKGGRVGELLVQLKACGEEQVLKALAAQLELPYQVRIANDEISPEMIKRVPINFAKQAKLLPLRYEPAGEGGAPLPESTAIVAMADPLDLSGLDHARLLTGVPISPLLVPSQAILDCHQRRLRSRQERGRAAGGRPRRERPRHRGPRARRAAGPARVERRSADHPARQLAALPRRQGARQRYPHRAAGARHQRPLPHRRRAARGDSPAQAIPERRSSRA